MLKGFKLLDTKKTPAEICQLALDAHTGGGHISGNTYSNPGRKLKLTAPEGWEGTAYASQHLFRVRFQCQAGASNVLFQGMAPPVGYTSWTVGKANQLFLHSCANRELETASDIGWTSAQGFRWREAQNRKDQAPSILRVAMRGKVLVLMTGEAQDQAVLGDIRKAMSSLVLLKSR